MANPRGEPNAIRRLKGDTSKGKKPIPEKDLLPASMPSKPQDFTNPLAAEQWDLLMEVLAGADLLATADQWLCYQFCECWAKWYQANKNVSQQGAVLVNSANNPVRNPWAIQESEKSVQLHRFYAELGLSPSARTKLQSGGKENKVEVFLKKYAG